MIINGDINRPTNPKMFLELWYPVLRLREEGAIVHVVGEEAMKVYTGKHGVPVESDFSFKGVNPDNYDAIFVPGGWSPN